MVNVVQVYKYSFALVTVIPRIFLGEFLTRPPESLLHPLPPLPPPLVARPECGADVPRGDGRRGDARRRRTPQDAAAPLRLLRLLRLLLRPPDCGE